jgi:23S rRNA pseudouridine1911/1915/1917 synthase
MRFFPHTGRTHQIRVHCAYAGFSIIADSSYGGGRKRAQSLACLDRPFAFKMYACFSRQALHAWRISFMHPFLNKMVNFEAPFPDDFRAAFTTFGLESLLKITEV